MLFMAGLWPSSAQQRPCGAKAPRFRCERFAGGAFRSAVAVGICFAVVSALRIGIGHGTLRQLAMPLGNGPVAHDACELSRQHVHAQDLQFLLRGTKNR